MWGCLCMGHGKTFERPSELFDLVECTISTETFLGFVNNKELNEELESFLIFLKMSDFFEEYIEKDEMLEYCLTLVANYQNKKRKIEDCIDLEDKALLSAIEKFLIALDKLVIDAIEICKKDVLNRYCIWVHIFFHISRYGEFSISINSDAIFQLTKLGEHLEKKITTYLE